MTVFMKHDPMNAASMSERTDKTFTVPPCLPLLLPSGQAIQDNSDVKEMCHVD
jgi:hypothetical protein